MQFMNMYNSLNNLGQLWLGYTEFQGDSYMLQFKYIDCTLRKKPIQVSSKDVGFL